MTQEPFGDIPLFREIQKLLSSGDGPINFEIARQIAVAVAAQGTADRPVEASDTRAFADAVHEAETLISGYTRLPLDEPLRPDAIGRTQWISTTMDGWRWLLEHLATRFTAELARLGAEEAEGGVNPMQAAMGQMGPLLMGMQVGTLIGHLSKEALGRYDFPIPREDDGRLFFVVPNLDALAQDYGFDLAASRRWIAAHDVARHLVITSVPWAGRFFRSLLTDVVDAIEIDVEGLEQRLVELQSRGPEAMQEGMGQDGVVPIASTEKHRAALDRMRAFLAVLEGYGAETMSVVGPQIVPEHEARIAEGMARQQASPSEGEAMLSSILGVSLDRQLEVSGATFCKAILELKGLSALNRVWAAPDNLPSIAEVKDPFVWIERVLDP
ncbi:MAG: zinc-dependent metalloprotease [Actinomycetota bacterium]|nr:zinc-dependent metalloprotease [Actinomycetota bacterium]